MCYVAARKKTKVMKSYNYKYDHYIIKGNYIVFKNE